MSIHERLRHMETEVQQMRIRPAAEIRARGRRRGQRQRAVMAAGVAVVAATGGIAAFRAAGPPDPDTPVAGPAVPCVLSLPDDPGDVRVRVLPGGAPAGMADATATQLRERRLVVLMGATGANGGAATTLTYGPAAIGAATVVRAMVHGDTTMSFDPGRTDDVVDLALGKTFTRLGTTTEINQALAAAGEPSAPPQC